MEAAEIRGAPGAESGEPILSVGLLPEAAAYKPYFMESAVAATLRGETPQVLVQGGGLGVVGSPVFNTDGKAIGVVPAQTGQSGLLNEGNGRNLPAAQTPAEVLHAQRATSPEPRGPAAPAASRCRCRGSACRR